MNMYQCLSQCINPLATALVYNPTRPEYYRASEAPAQATQAADPAVRVTLSSEAQAALNGE